MAGNALHAGRTVVSKVAAILTTFTNGNTYTMTEIARLTELPVSTAHRLLTELAARGLLDRAVDGTFRAGVTLRILGRGWPRPAPSLEVRAPRLLEDLCQVTGTVVRVGRLCDLAVVYMEKRPGYRPTSTFTAAATLPVHASAAGKALLAFSSPPLVEFVILQGLRAYTPATVTTPDRFRHELAVTRLRRMAISNGELQRGKSWIAAPVFGDDGDVVAAIELYLCTPDTDLAIMVPSLKIAARSLSRELAQPATTRGVAFAQVGGPGRANGYVIGRSTIEDWRRSSCDRVDPTTAGRS